jgi:hypothetical protein
MSQLHEKRATAGQQQYHLAVDLPDAAVRLEKSFAFLSIKRNVHLTENAFDQYFLALSAETR